MQSLYPRTNRMLKTSLLCVSVLTLQACLSMSPRGVSESNKDTTGNFDGDWIAVGKRTAAVQTGIGNWRHTCGNQEGVRFGPLRVSNGEAIMGFDQNEGRTYVDPAGKFRIEVPINATATTTGASEGQFTDNSMNIILSGSLAKQTGKLTFGIQELGNTGCTSSVTFEQL